MAAQPEKLTCPGCGYDLRGLPDEGQCPECATPVWTAQYPDLLQFADPHWLASLARGTRLMAIGCIMPWSVALLAAAQGLGLPDRFMTIAASSILAISAFAMLAGMWLLTSPNPADSNSERPLSPRRLARTAGVVCAFSVAVAIPAHVSGISPLVVVVANGIASPLGLGGVVLIWHLTGYVQQLAVRGRCDDNLARGTVYRRGYLICWCLFAPGTFGGMMGWGMFACLAVPGVAGGLIFGALALLLPAHLVSDLKKIVAEAVRIRSLATAHGGQIQRPPAAFGYNRIQS